MSRRLTPRTPSFRKLDFFDKSVDGVRDISLFGALVSTGSLGFMVLLFVSELYNYLTVNISSHMRVSEIHDITETVVHLHLSFPHVGCNELNLEVENIRGGKILGESATQYVNVRLPNRDEMRHFGGVTVEESGKIKSCTMEGDVTIARVGGMIHIKVENSSQNNNVAFDHYIHDLSFGQPIPGIKSPLKDVYVKVPFDTARVAYLLKVVPTSYRTSSGRTTNSFQYSAVSEYESKDVINMKRDSRHGAGIHFSYDFTPVMVRLQEESEGFFQFFTSSCAIIGGLFTMCGLLVGLVQNVRRSTKSD